MKLTKQSRRDAKALFRSTFVNGVMDEAKVRTVVQKLMEAKPRGYLAILEHLKRLVKLEQDRRSAKIESAVGSAQRALGNFPGDIRAQQRLIAALGHLGRRDEALAQRDEHPGRIDVRRELYGEAFSSLARVSN